MGQPICFRRLKGSITSQISNIRQLRYRLFRIYIYPYTSSRCSVNREWIYEPRRADDGIVHSWKVKTGRRLSSNQSSDPVPNRALPGQSCTAERATRDSLIREGLCSIGSALFTALLSLSPSTTCCHFTRETYIIIQCNDPNLLKEWCPKEEFRSRSLPEDWNINQSRLIFHYLLFCFFFCSVDDDLRVQITDNALARDLFPQDYHCLGDNENRPIKWLAIESLISKTFTTASDVVSICLFSILSF